MPADTIRAASTSIGNGCFILPPRGFRNVRAWTSVSWKRQPGEGARFERRITSDSDHDSEDANDDKQSAKRIADSHHFGSLRSASTSAFNLPVPVNQTSNRPNRKNCT